MKRSGFQEMSPFAYPFYTMLHPKDGFQEAKMNGKISVFVTVTLVTAYIFAEMMYRFFAAFDLNTYNPDRISAIRSIAILILVFIIATLSNWCFCTLLDGKGKYKEICYVVSCALLPMTLVRFLTTPLSMILTVDETIIMTYPVTISQVWALLLLAVGLSEIHDYSAKMTLLSLVLTVVGILIILFLCLLLVLLFRQLYVFAGTLYFELKYY